jgi:hypothetical protein
MSSGRTYNVTFRSVSVAAAQDLIAVYAGASMAFEVIGFGLSPGNTTVENLLINLKHLPATVTAGSGGSAGTMQKDNPTDAAATVTSRINDTTPATTGGTADYPHSDGYNEVNGFEWIFPERSRPVAKLSEAMVFEVVTAPGAGRTLSGWMKIRELF